MFWKFLKPSALIALFVIVVWFSVVGLRKSWIAATANDEFLCAVVVGLQGQVSENYWQATVGDDNHVILIPTPQAYSRLKLGKEFTFVYRQGELIAIADGNLCGK